ncbi:MAG: sulfotransferase [Bacteroidota bacterium]
MEQLVTYIRRRGRPYKGLLLPVWLQVQRTWLWQRLMEGLAARRPARTRHVFCVGLPKTGTHSLAAMVQCRSAHEPETHTLAHLYTEALRGQMTRAEQVAVLRARDALWWLDLEANWLFGLVIEALFEAFPDAKFILTTRDPVSWIESQINEEHAYRRTEPYRSVERHMYGGGPYTPEDARLKQEGFHPLRGYLSYWVDHNRRVLDTIPPDQLLVVPVEELSARLDEVAAFVGAPVVPQRSHRYKRSNKAFQINDLVDPAYLAREVEQYTQSMAARLQAQCLSIPSSAPRRS